MPQRSEKMYFEHTHMKLSSVQHQISMRDGVLAYPSPLSPPPSIPLSPSPSSDSKTNHAALFLIVVFAVFFFISGVLHFLVRFLMKNPSSLSQSNDNYPEVSTSDALERQLQQLFHLHDSGLDQAFIDVLPVFTYEEIVVGVAKEPFDCAVCLCQFSDNDQLRLLPTCCHAFHINCIDMWLLSNSSCPLCRGALVTPGVSIENSNFDFDDFGEDDESLDNGENKRIAIGKLGRRNGVLPVRLGKFRKIDNFDEVADVGETSSSNLDARRCYSMGSYQYVVGDTTLKVALIGDRIRSDMKLEKGLKLNSDPTNNGDTEGKKLTIGSKTDSYSVSKIWLWSKKGKFASSSDA